MAAEEPLACDALPRISVIVPSYNQGQFLRECFESIFRQQYPHLEVVVMDGGSTDGSVEIIRSYAPRLKYWQSQRDGGQSAAINAGMQHCTGDLVSWLNSDDFYCEDALWTLARAWMQHPGRGLYIGNGFRLDQETGAVKPFLERHVCLSRRGLLEGPDYILQPATFFLRDAFLAVNGLVPELRYCMDWDIYLRISRKYPVVAMNEFLAVSREYADTKTRAGGLGRVNEIIRMIQSHSGKELTTGTFCYLLDTALTSVRGSITRNTEVTLENGVIRLLADFGEEFGDGAWCAAYADPQDDVYLPVARGPWPRRPRDPSAPPLPRISVVVLVEADSAALDDTLRSIFAQDYPDVEVLVVDAAGTVAAGAVAGYPDVRMLRPRRARRQARLINHGLAAARGEVLSWMPAGDLLAEGALHAAGAAFADDAELDVVYGNALFLDPRGEPCLVDLRPMRSAFWFGRFEPPRGQPGFDKAPYSVPQASVAFHRRAWERAGPLKDSYRHIHAYEWFLRVAAGGRVRKLDRTQAFCRVGTRVEPWRWHESLVELYRFSRPQWPRRGTPEYEEAIEDYGEYFLCHKFGILADDEPGHWGMRLACLLARLRVVNPERWRRQGFIVTPRGAPPFHIPPPEPIIRSLLPLANAEELPQREGTTYRAAVCLARAPRHPGALGTEAREFQLLAEVCRCSVVELFTFRSARERTSALPADAVYTPEQMAHFRLDHLWRGLPPRNLVLRLLDGLRGLSIPVAGPANPLQVSQQFVRVRGYCVQALQERLDRGHHRADFLFIADQGNPAALALDTADTTTRLILIAHGSEADRLQRQVASSWGLSRLAAKLEARRGQRFEAANLDRFDGIIVASEVDRARFMAEYAFPAERIDVAGRAVDTAWWGTCPRRPASPAIVEFLGNLDDPQDALAARRFGTKVLPQLRQQAPEIVGWILDVGLGRTRRRSTIGAARVLEVGDDVRPHLAQAAVVCLPHQGGGLTRSAAAEVLAAGVPLVATSAAAEGLAIDPGVHYRTGNLDNELAAAIVELLQSPQSAAALARAGQEQVQRHHASTMQLAGFRDWLDRLARMPRRCHDSGAEPKGGVAEPAAA
jgi:glycosyltransferase involved in cell wall biosynthesis